MRFVLIVLFLATAACAAPSQKAQEARPGGEGSLQVQIDGIDSTKGLVYASIYLNEDGFPEDKSKAFDYKSAPATVGEPIVLTFDKVPAGWVAVAVLHDSDGNEKLTLSVLGIPEEQYGFSKNADSTWGPPPFDDAAIMITAGQEKKIVVKVH